MSRTIDLKKHLPQVTKSEEMIEIMDTESKVFQEKWETLSVIQMNRFISTVDEKGIRWFERLLRIIRKGTLEDRRKKVYYEWNKKIIYTDRTLRELLDNLLGEDAYDIEFKYNDYEIIFEIYISKTDFNLAELFILLREIIPANEIIRFDLIIKELLQFESTYQDFNIQNYITGTNRHKCGTIHKRRAGVGSKTEIQVADRTNVVHNRIPKTGEIKTRS